MQQVSSNSRLLGSVFSQFHRFTLSLRARPAPRSCRSAPGIQDPPQGQALLPPLFTKHATPELHSCREVGFQGSRVADRVASEIAQAGHTRTS